MQSRKSYVIPIGTDMDITDDNILCPELGLKWETEFTILGFTIDNKLAKLNSNISKCTTKVKALIAKWRSYNLSINGRITIAKTILLPQYTYVGSVLDNISQNQYKGIQKVIDHFILYNSYCEQNKKSRKWIKDDILYGDKAKGGYGHIRVTDFFQSIKTSWIKRYATQLIDDHWCDLIDLK